MAYPRIQSIVAALVALFLISGLQGVQAAAADDYVAKAREYVAGGEVKSAIIELKNALQSDPSHVEARLMLGAQYMRRGEAAAAAKEFGRARDLGAPSEAWQPGWRARSPTRIPEPRPTDSSSAVLSLSNLGRWARSSCSTARP